MEKLPPPRHPRSLNAGSALCFRTALRARQHVARSHLESVPYTRSNNSSMGPIDAQVATSQSMAPSGRIRHGGQLVSVLLGGWSRLCRLSGCLPAPRARDNRCNRRDDAVADRRLRGTHRAGSAQHRLMHLSKPRLRGSLLGSGHFRRPVDALVLLGGLLKGHHGRMPRLYRSQEPRADLSADSPHHLDGYSMAGQ